MNRLHKIINLTASLALCLGLAGCNLPGSAEKQAEEMAVQQTSVAQTVVALQTAMVVGTTPAAPLIPTNTPETVQPATETPTATLLAATPTVTNTPMPSYRIGSVSDVTYPDDTVVTPGTSFTKTWRLTNSGTGTWGSNFRVVFVSGDAMGGPASFELGQSVAPGQSVNVSVTLTAPTTAGKTYQGKWMMATETGATFGLGTNADGVFWVKIKTDQPFMITSAIPVVSPTSYSGTCPTTLVFTANITSTSAGTATYYIMTSIANSPTYELKFSKAETLTTGTYTVQVDTTQTVTAAVYNDYPNHQQFPTLLSIPVTCTP